MNEEAQDNTPQMQSCACGTSWDAGPAWREGCATACPTCHWRRLAEQREQQLKAMGEGMAGAVKMALDAQAERFMRFVLDQRLLAAYEDHLRQQALVWAQAAFGRGPEHWPPPPPESR